MNHNGITIDETFTEIAHSINNGSHNTLDFLFNFITASMFIGAAIGLIWLSCTIISIMRSK